MNEAVRRRGLFTSEAFAKACERLVGLLDATKIERAPRGPDGVNNYVEVPDNAARLGAVKLIIELETGKAPQSLDITLPANGAKQPTENDALVLLKANPAMAQRVLGDYLDVMKIAQRAGNLGACIELPASTSENESGKRQR